MAGHPPHLGGDGSVPRRDAGPIYRSTTRQLAARYTVTRSIERDLPDAEFGAYSCHASAINDSTNAVAWCRWPYSEAKQRCVLLEAGPLLDPPIVLRLTSFEVISVTQPRTRRLLISLAGESPWDFDYSPGQDLLLLVANDGTRGDYGRYLIKRSNPRIRHLSIEAVLESDGPAARWAASVVPGEPVSGIGPREVENGMGTALRLHPARGSLDSLGIQRDIPGPDCPFALKEPDQASCRCESIQLMVTGVKTDSVCHSGQMHSPNGRSAGGIGPVADPRYFGLSSFSALQHSSESSSTVPGDRQRRPTISRRRGR